MNVIWIISDTLRCDHLGCYGNPDIHTPSLDTLAERSVRFGRHYIASFPTMPTRADYYTGRWTGTFFPGWAPLPRDMPLLPEALSENGFSTTAVVDTPFYLRRNYNYDRGFYTFYQIPGQPAVPAAGESRDDRSAWRSEADRCAPRTFTKAMEWLEGHYKEDFFLYIDAWDPHEPWDAPDYYTERYWPEGAGEIVMPSHQDLHWTLRDAEAVEPDAEKMSLAHAFYCGEVTMVDTWTGRLLRHVENLGLMENTAIVFTSDHGTYHGEHGGRFGKTTQAIPPEGSAVVYTPGYSPLYEEVVASPLLVYLPGVTPGVYNGLTSAIDLAPTVLDILGLELLPGTEGRSLLPAVKDTAVVGPEYVVSGPPFRNKATSVVWADGRIRSLDNDASVTITTDEWSLVYAVEPGLSELYHLPSDPGQENNVIHDNPETAREVHRHLVHFMDEHDFSPELRDPRSELRP